MKKLLLVLLSLSSTAALADTIYLGNPSYGGTGCPQGSASASLSPDNQSLSILFDNYVAEAGNSTGRQFDRKSCNVSIPVHVPQGYSVSVFQVDYRGFNGLPAGGSSQFNVEYFFAGARGPSYSRRFYGALSSNYTVSNTLVASALIWSACGKDVNLRTNSNMLVTTNSNYDEAMATVDSVDIGANLIFHLQWRRC